MKSILFIDNDPKTNLEQALAFTKTQAIHKHDVFLLESVSKENTKKTPDTSSIGIEVIKKLKQAAFLRPSQGKEKAIIIANAHELTIPAQNALLKILEEPPESTYFILTATSEDAFLPTIISRCSVITFTHKSEPLGEDMKQSLQKEYKELSLLPLATLLKKAEQLAKDKKKAQEYLKSLTVIVREELLTQVNDETMTLHHIRTLQSLSELHKIIQFTNTSLRLSLEQFFLSFKT